MSTTNLRETMRIGATPVSNIDMVAVQDAVELFHQHGGIARLKDSVPGGWEFLGSGGEGAVFSHRGSAFKFYFNRKHVNVDRARNLVLTKRHCNVAEYRNVWDIGDDRAVVEMELVDGTTVNDAVRAVVADVNQCAGYSLVRPGLRNMSNVLLRADGSLVLIDLV